jgi:hypothetical protein
MSFLRHVGKIGDRKVAIVFREVPNETHMCLVAFTDTLNRHIHDPMMKCIESDIGQSSQNLADALNRTHTQDGKYILQVLHSQGMLKKVQTETVVVTPNSNTRIKLSDLNKILDEMEQGEAAVKRLAEIDSSRGIQDANQVAQRARDRAAEASLPPVTKAEDGLLSDSLIAKNLRNQASKMEAEARGLLAESARLQTEASSLDGVASMYASPNASNVPAAPVAKKRGRPAKVKVLV